jgi:thiol-disulfide isomerase/thioredoxin
MPPAMVSPLAPAVPARRVSQPKLEARGSTPFVAASCTYDARHRRLEQFTMSDLDGKEVRLADLDADLILIDFWGTWCAPCLKAMPELVALQQEFGPAGLAVVGIAYEQGDPADWPKQIADATASFGVNYRLLMAEADGKPCPLRAALQVQVFPTLVLIDRQGQVLWRDQGATPANMRRMRRIIEAKLKTNLAVRDDLTVTR